MVITPIIELQMLDKFELIDRVHRAELRAANAEMMLSLGTLAKIAENPEAAVEEFQAKRN